MNGSVRSPWTSEQPYSLTNKQIKMEESSQVFFHFLRLMQLFPSVHPATLHTVLTLCKNDFFSAVEKLLNAKFCKENKGAPKGFKDNEAIFLNAKGSLVIPDEDQPEDLTVLHVIKQ